jgi:hemin uptake protein HemP
MQLKNISFPLFAIGSYKRLWEENLILYLESHNDIIYIVDNKNFAEKTIGKRRLRIPKKDRYKFIGTVFNLDQLLQSKRKIFIDNKGVLFKYKKTKRAELIYREIKKVKRVEDEGILVYANKIPVPIEVPTMLYSKQKYIGLLNYNGGYILYELTDDKKEDTWRKI